MLSMNVKAASLSMLTTRSPNASRRAASNSSLARPSVVATAVVVDIDTEHLLQKVVGFAIQSRAAVNPVLRHGPARFQGPGGDAVNLCLGSAKAIYLPSSSLD